MGVALATLASFFLVGVGVGSVTNITQYITNNNAPNHRTGTANGPATDDWQNDRSAWTVILASVRTRGQAEAAVEQARRVPHDGRTLGILDSDDYHLEPNYWVAFTGQYDTEAEAIHAASRYNRWFNDPFQRFIEER